MYSMAGFQKRCVFATQMSLSAGVGNGQPSHRFLWGNSLLKVLSRIMGSGARHTRSISAQLIQADVEADALFEAKIQVVALCQRKALCVPARRITRGALAWDVQSSLFGTVIATDR